jgi:hypothetical protein
MFLLADVPPASPAPIWPAIWSALAATFSAITALVLLRVHLHNRAESVRPELLLDEWEYFPEQDEESRFGSTYGLFIVKRLRNVGRGTALHIYARVQMMSHSDDEPHVIYSRIARIGVNQEVTINWAVFFPWEGRH